MAKIDKNLYWHKSSVTLEDRWQSYAHRSCVLWFTGLSASGKSTLSNLLCKELLARGVKSYVLDGDNVRHGLNRDLGFSPGDRKENIRRIGEVSKLFVDAGLIVMTAFISPYLEDRCDARKLFREGEFIEIFLKCSLSECESRDPKGIYKKARAGEIGEFTGISSPYEEPLQPEITLNTEAMDCGESMKTIMKYLKMKNII